MLEDLPENEITKKIIGCAIEVHSTYGGPGLKESAYEVALAWELQQLGLKVARQKPVPIIYKGHVFESNDEHPKRIDLLVEDSVIVEVKAVSDKAKDATFRAQCKTYLKMLGHRVGLVINFGRPTLFEGVERVINESKEEYRARLKKTETSISTPAARNTERAESRSHGDEIHA